MAKIGHSNYNRAKTAENTRQQVDRTLGQQPAKRVPVKKPTQTKDHRAWNEKHGLGQKADTYPVTAKNHKALGVHPTPEDLKKLNTTKYDKHKGEPTQWHTEKGKRVVTAQSAHRVSPTAKMTHPTVIKGSLEDNRSNEAYKVYRKSDRQQRKVVGPDRRIIKPDKSIEDLKQRHEKALDKYLKQKQADEINKKAHDTAKRLSHDKRKAAYIRREQTKDWNTRQKIADEQARLVKGTTVSKELARNQNITHKLLTDKTLTEGQKKDLKNQRVSKEKLDALKERRGRETNKKVYGQAFHTTMDDSKYIHQQHATRSLEKTKKNKGVTRQDKKAYMLNHYLKEADNMENGKRKKDINGKVVKVKGVSLSEAYDKITKANRENYFGTPKKITTKKTPAAKTTRKQTKKEKKEYIKGEDW